jgi:ABC-type bacteriocin/lantibiotic exporter with double-glycine peptidase domain
MKPRPVHALVAALALLAGCAGDHNRGARPGGDEGPHLAVPFFPDRRDQWGPASLASVLTFYGHPSTPEELRREIHFPKQPGSVALDVKYAVRARGLNAEMSTGTLDVVKRELDGGRPVIVLFNTGFRWAPIRSYMVVTGYNEWLHGVYAHFGPNKDYFLHYRQFEKDWENAGRWILLVSAPGSAPAKPVMKAQVCEPARVERRARPARDAAVLRCPAPPADAEVIR